MRTLKEIKEYLCESGFEDVILYDSPSYATAFLGLSHDDRAIYDYEAMIEWLVVEDGMDEEEAAEYIDYNCAGAYTEGGPIILYPMR